MLAGIQLEDNELGEAAGKVRRKPPLPSRRQPMLRQKGSKPVYSPKTVQHVAGGAGQPVSRLLEPYTATTRGSSQQH